MCCKFKTVEQSIKFGKSAVDFIAFVYNKALIQELQQRKKVVCDGNLSTFLLVVSNIIHFGSTRELYVWLGALLERLKYHKKLIPRELFW